MQKRGNVTEISKITFKEHLSDVWEQQRPTASHYTDYRRPVPRSFSIIYINSYIFDNSEVDKNF